jgi:hypothetical protein
LGAQRLTWVAACGCEPNGHRRVVQHWQASGTGSMNNFAVVVHQCHAADWLASTRSGEHFAQFSCRFRQPAGAEPKGSGISRPTVGGWGWTEGKPQHGIDRPTVGGWGWTEGKPQHGIDRPTVGGWGWTEGKPQHGISRPTGATCESERSAATPRRIQLACGRRVVASGGSLPAPHWRRCEWRECRKHILNSYSPVPPGRGSQTSSSTSSCPLDPMQFHSHRAVLERWSENSRR